MGENDARVCDVCGVTSADKIVRWVARANQWLCSKHKKQFYDYGKITDPSPRTTHDKNEYVLHDDYAEIILCDSMNAEQGRALIDLEDVEKCKLLKWSIQGSGYARSKKPGFNTSLHRYILGYKEELDVDHVNHNKLDNRKHNLRIVLRPINVANTDKHKCYSRMSNGMWRVEVTRWRKRFYGGIYRTEEKAIAARDNLLAQIKQNEQQYIDEYNLLNKTRIIGVTITPSGKWRARLWIGGKCITIGLYDTQQEAAAAREAYIKRRNEQSA